MRSGDAVSALDWSPSEATCRPGRYFVLECFSCGELAEAERLGKESPRCSCGLPYSVEMRIRRGYPSLSVGMRRALYRGVERHLPRITAEAPSVPVTGLEGMTPMLDAPQLGTRRERALARAALAGLGGALGSIRRAK